MGISAQEFRTRYILFQQQIHIKIKDLQYEATGYILQVAEP